MKSLQMTNYEIRMTNKCRSPNDEKRFRIWSLVILSTFVIGHSSFAQTQRPVAGAGLGQERVTVDDKTEQVIRGALKWLASKQNSNGSWTASDASARKWR